MGKKRYTDQYFDITPILKQYDVTYYVVYGEREDGKSYTVKLNKCIEDYAVYKKRFVYIRRLHQHIVRRNMIKVFDDMQDIAVQRLGSKIYFDAQVGFYIINSSGEHEVIGYCTSLQDAMLVKSIPITNVSCILFDEFIDYTYMEDEIPKFLHTISTICRPPNENVKIFMLGNTISKDCPYFELFGIDTRKISQGEPYFIQHSLGVSAVVYHTPTKVKNLITKSKHNQYIGFDDNNSVNMIMFGEWEYNNCITGKIDGVGWNCMRHLIPIYLTALGNVYEFTINTDIKIPILFVRKVNTQNGVCGTKIKYNLTYDRTVNLINKNGIVPSFTHINEFIDDDTICLWDMGMKCLKCGRVIFDNVATGSEFLHLIEKIEG